MIMVTGDVHRKIDNKKLQMEKTILGQMMTKDDFIIVAGDFGGIWYGGVKDDKYLNSYKNQPYTLLFIDGNHENFDLLEKYPIKEWNGGLVREIRPDVLHLMRGQIFNIPNERSVKNYTKIFTFGGALSVDKKQRTEGRSWWSQELPTQEEYDIGLKNLKKENWKVDAVITHTAPTRLLNLLINKNSKQTTHLEDYLENIMNKISYKKWCFGHFHKDIDFSNNTHLLYNEFVEIR